MSNSLLASDRGKPDGLLWPYWPQPKQEECWEMMSPYSRTTVNGYGGPKFGGKSWNIRGIGNTQCMDKPLTAIVFGREYESLKDLHVEPIKAEMRDFMDAGLLEWNENNKRFYFPETGSIFRVQQVQRPKDIHRHNGKRFDLVLIDEAQNFTDFELKYFQTLAGPSPIAMAAREKVRMHIIAAKTKEEKKRYEQMLADMYYLPKVLYCFNWGDVGHNYLVTRFWEGCDHPENPGRDTTEFETEEYEAEDGKMKTRWVEDPEEFRYVFADWKDNEIGYNENPQYIRSLKRLPEPYRTAYVRGDPYAFAGLKFKVVDPIHDLDVDEYLAPYGGVIPEHWSLFGALDPGTASPCSFSLYFKTPSGLSVQISDYYESDRSFEQHVEGIYEHILSGPHTRWTQGRMPKYIIAGHDAWHKKSRYMIHAHDSTFADVFWAKPYRLRLTKANTDRIAGAMAVANALQYDLDDKTGDFKKPPSYRFGVYYTTGRDGTQKKVDLCKVTKDCLSSLKSDEHNPEDIDRSADVEDHPYDKARYYIMGSPAPKDLEDPGEGKYAHSDYGRHPSRKVYKREESDGDDDLMDTFGVGDLEKTL